MFAAGRTEKGEMMRTRFENQLKELNDALIFLGAECEDCLTYSMQALVTGQKVMIERAMECEKNTDSKKREIQAMCMRILQQQQPVAGDLRVVSAALRMIIDMERIADQGSDIAEISSHVDFTKSEFNKLLTKMADITIKMLNTAVSAFVKRDSAVAASVEAMDDEVDELFLKEKSILVEMMSGSEKTDEKTAEQMLETLMIAKYFERIGDHTVNIAHSVLGMLDDGTGRRQG